MKFIVDSSHINKQKYIKAVRSSKLWKFAASEWHRLYRPYCPFKEGALYSTVRISGETLNGTIEHTVPYAHYMYEGRVMGPNVPITQGGRIVGFFSPTPMKHYTGTMIQYSGTGSAHWDKAAKPTQEPVLIREMQKYVDSGVLGLGG